VIIGGGDGPGALYSNFNLGFDSVIIITLITFALLMISYKLVKLTRG
jgi:hypothetical protein